MFHPKARIQWINDTVGYGLVAVEFIPKGTITYVKDPLELEISMEKFVTLPKELQAAVDKYSYVDEKGNHIVSWDLSKYVNHCCQCNSMSTGYGFEIAIRDIQPGEEITDEYGIFNMEEAMYLDCGKPGCRRRIHGEDLESYYQIWDQQLKSALRQVRLVNQPLWFLLEEDTIGELNSFLSNEIHYRSVKDLRYTGHQHHGEE